MTITLETGCCGLSQREEDVTHHSWTAHTGGCDDGEDTVHVRAQVLLQKHTRIYEYIGMNIGRAPGRTWYMVIMSQLRDNKVEQAK